MIEFSDLVCKCSSNFMLIGLKLRILEIWPTLTFWSMLTPNIVSGWIQWPDMQMLFKFQVNQMKIEDFINSACVDLLTIQFTGSWIQRPDIKMLFKFQVNRMKIEDFRNLAQIGLLAYVSLKINRWMNSVTWYANSLQISS